MTETVLTRRMVPLQKGINFRDFGGYASCFGGEVKTGTLFRCGHLTELSDDDLATLRDLDIQSVHDFRRPEERQRAPSRDIGATVVDGYDIRVGSLSNFWELLKRGDLTGALSHKLVVESYGQCHEEVADPYRRLFQNLLDHRQGALVIHCAAGKDRTGMAAALIQGALGVSEEDIIADYLLTQSCFDHQPLLDLIEDHLRKEGVSQWESDWVMPYCQVHEDNIRAFLGSLQRHYGGVEKYIESALGVSQEGLLQLRRQFLVESVD